MQAATAIRINEKSRKPNQTRTEKYYKKQRKKLARPIRKDGKLRDGKTKQKRKTITGHSTTL